MPGEIFISYRRSDRKWAAILHERLKECGVDSWYDAHVGAGSDWRSETAHALQRATTFVLLYSKAAAASTDMAKELAVATLERKTVVPVRLENISPSGPFLYELASLNWIDAFDDTDADLTELANRLAGAAFLPTPKRVPRSQFRWQPQYALWIAIVLLANLFGAGWWWMHRPAAAPHPPLTAVFDFATPPGDTALSGVVDGISDTIVSTLAAMQLPLVSRAETQSLPPAERLIRARALGARFVIAGNIRRNGDALAVAARIEDLASGTTAWSASFEGPSAAAALLETQVAARTTDTLRCATRERDSIDAGSFSLMLATCDRKGGRSGDPDALRELMARLPESATARSWLAISLTERAGEAPPIAKAEMLREAEAAARRAIALDPHLGDAHYAIGQLAEARHTGYAERESIVLRGLAADPSHPSINRQYGSLLQEVGRERESLGYLELAVRGDPLSPFKPLVLATTLDALGRDADADRVLDDVMTRWPSPTLWRAPVKYAALAGDVALTERLLAKAPSSAKSPEDDSCLPKLARSVAAAKAGHAPHDGAALVRRCVASRSITWPTEAFAAIGAVDDAYAAFRRMLQDGAHPSLVLFRPSTRAMRRDPRFLPLMRELGLVDYWRVSRKWPDFCQEPGIAFDCKRELGPPR